jgi:hypothetical protein
MINQETFAALLQVVPYEGLDEAIGMNNALPQGPVLGPVRRFPGTRRAVVVLGACPRIH